MRVYIQNRSVGYCQIVFINESYLISKLGKILKALSVSGNYVKGPSSLIGFDLPNDLDIVSILKVYVDDLEIYQDSPIV